MGKYLPRSWVSPKVVLGESKIANRGVFAAQPIARGEKVMEFGGHVISAEQADSGDYRYRSIWPVAPGSFLALPESDPDLSLDEYLNHSCDANCWLEGEAVLMARRDIAPGEEITLDQGTWNLEPGYIEDGSPCACGVADCRGPLTENDWRLPAVRKRYAGHFHPMIASIAV